MPTEFPDLDPTNLTYDRIARQYADKWFDDPTLDRAKEIFAERIAGNAPPERFRILDAGCGPGQASKWFHDRGFQVVGVDRSAGMLDEARRRVPGVEFRQADLRHLDFPDGSFDGIWCSAALLHLPRTDVPTVLKTFNRLLGHGYLWLSVKGGDGDEIVAGEFGPGNPRRFTYFSRCEIELSIERAGFEIHDLTETDPTGGSSRPWLSVLAQTALHSPLLGAVAIVFDDNGRVLLSERADGRGWNLPGGIVDADEGPDDAAVREAREETGLDVVVERLVSIGTAPRVYRGYGPPVSGTLVSHGFLCRAVGGALVLTNEALQHGWFDPSALPSPMSSRRHVDLIQTAVAMREGRVIEPTIRHYGSSTVSR
jgi:8-oxo-dGTP pyrophosphatase MutT (NUDIX family)